MKITYLNDYHYFDSSSMPQDPVVVQVGVYQDPSLSKIRELYPKAEIWAYEAAPKNYEAMQKGMEEIKAHSDNRALSLAGGSVPLNIYTNPVSNSLFNREGGEYILTERLIVEGISPRGLVSNTYSKCIDLIILNCEGAEIFFLEELLISEWLRDRVAQVCVSLHAPRIYSTERKQALLKGLGEFYHVVEEPQKIYIPDVLLVRKT